jgi:dCTP deaminase
MIVRDAELKTLIQRVPNPLLTDFEAPRDWDADDSLVQPCSIDLHVGEIYEPGVKPGKSGSTGYPKVELVLETGHTAIVTTKESIHVPSDYGGFGFPLNSVSARGLLMTNPGHVDPGFSGKLQFTVINMGREPFCLRRKDPIVTLLIFKLSTAVDTDYAARHPGTPVPASIVKQDNLDRLARDFVDVTRRARSIAIKTLAGATVAAAIVSWIVNGVEKNYAGIDVIQSRLTQVEDANKSLAEELRVTRTQLEKQIDIDRRLATIEAQASKSAQPQIAKRHP